MKVILLQDVAKIGRRFDVVTVPDGYGLNKLIPQGMAKPATPENLKAVNAQAAKGAAAKAEADAAFTTMLEKAESASLAVAVEANEQGHLFEALKPEVVAAEIEAKTGVAIAPAQIHIKTPIKEVGEHHIGLVSGTTEAFVTIMVSAK